MLVLACPRITRDSFCLEGILHRPGELICESELWPDERAPRIPVLIERARSPRSRAGVCPYMYKGESLYVLWRYEMAEQEWIEVSRCYSTYGDWWPVLHPLILRELTRSDEVLPANPDLAVMPYKNR
jgi:hypothetical protein